MKFTISRLVWSGLVGTTKWWSGLLAMCGGLILAMASESYRSNTGVSIGWGIVVGCGGITYAMLRLLMAMFNASNKSGRFNVYSCFMASMILITLSTFKISKNFNPEQLSIMMLVGCMLLWVAVCAVFLKLLRLCRDADIFLAIAPWQDRPEMAQWMWYMMCQYNTALTATRRKRHARKAVFDVLNLDGGNMATVALMNRLLGTDVKVRRNQPTNTINADDNSSTGFGEYYRITVDHGGWSNIPAKDGD